MKIFIKFLIVLTFIFGATSKAKWPESIPRCYRHDPNFVKCLRTAAVKALPSLAKGIPSLGMGKLDPLEMINFTIENDKWPVVLRVDMTNTGISGQSKLDIRDIRYNPATSILTISGFHKKLLMYGQYNVRGNILVFPLNSQGTFNFILKNIEASHTLKLSNTTRDGDHGNVGFIIKNLNHITIELKDPKLNTGANKALNKLVNDNWKIISGALTPSMERVIQKTFKKAFKPLFSKFSIEDIFPYQKFKEHGYNNTHPDKIKPQIHVLHPIVPVHPLIFALKK